jgi:hypothetical protein
MVRCDLCGASSAGPDEGADAHADASPTGTEVEADLDASPSGTDAEADAHAAVQRRHQAPARPNADASPNGGSADADASPTGADAHTDADDASSTGANAHTDAADASVPLSWVVSVEAGRTRTYCETCAREHLRSIEAKLDSQWW